MDLEKFIPEKYKGRIRVYTKEPETYKVAYCVDSESGIFIVGATEFPDGSFEISNQGRLKDKNKRGLNKFVKEFNNIPSEILPGYNPSISLGYVPRQRSLRFLVKKL